MSQNKDGADTFIANLRRIMDEKQLKQIDIVRGMKISNATVSQWVNGYSYPRIGMMQRLADFLSVSVADLTSPRRISEDPELAKFNEMIKKLSDDDKKLLLLTMQRLIADRK